MIAEVYIYISNITNELKYAIPIPPKANDLISSSNSSPFLRSDDVIFWGGLDDSNDFCRLIFIQLSILDSFSSYSS